MFIVGVLTLTRCSGCVNPTDQGHHTSPGLRVTTQKKKKKEKKKQKRKQQRWKTRRSNEGERV